MHATFVSGVICGYSHRTPSRSAPNRLSPEPAPRGCCCSAQTVKSLVSIPTTRHVPLGVGTATTGRPPIGRRWMTSGAGMNAARVSGTGPNQYAGKARSSRCAGDVRHDPAQPSATPSAYLPQRARAHVAPACSPTREEHPRGPRVGQAWILEGDALAVEVTAYMSLY